MCRLSTNFLLGKTLLAWDCLQRLRERNLNHPRTLVGVTRFGLHWVSLSADKQKSAAKTQDAAQSITN